MRGQTQTPLPVLVLELVLKRVPSREPLWQLVLTLETLPEPTQGNLARLGL